MPIEVAPIRGAIKTAVSTSTDTLVAGQDFSLFVTVQNPFEVPLTLIGVTAQLPTEFFDVEQRPDLAARNPFRTATIRLTHQGSRLPLRGTCPRLLRSASSLTLWRTPDLVDAVGRPIEVKSRAQRAAAGLPPSTVLQSGNSRTRTFTLRTKRRFLLDRLAIAYT